MKWMVTVAMAVLGAILGSFACCQAWRMHEKGKKLPARSVCMKCGRRLAWWENVPVCSWLVLRGRCRKCGKKIGVAEILMEVLGAGAYAGVYLAVIGEGASGWEWGRLVCLLALLVILGILAVHDGKWGELPVGLLLFAVILAGLALVCREVPRMAAGVDMRWEVLSVAMAVGMIAGLYFLLLKCSGGRLVGDGDWVLGLAVGLALADWWLALIVLAVSNLLAAGYGLCSHRRKIYFGPFMVVAFVLVICLEKVVCLSWI